MQYDWQVTLKSGSVIQFRLTPGIPAGDPHINECFNTLMGLSQELHTLEKSLWSEREPAAGKVSMELHDDELRHG